jgi:amino acid permease
MESRTQEMKLKELKNGRLAMLAFGGAITQALWHGFLNEMLLQKWNLLLLH